ncbi:hypothetical protein BG418_33190 [Streptomyces sp. CBMA152]|nr:hypothetical protein [Streptomyces sp. CBMA152]
MRRFVTSLPVKERPVHAHTAQAVAYDLWDAIETARANKASGLPHVRLPWREKAYRPLVFTRNYGWRVTPDGCLSLSLGLGQGRIVLPLPEFTGRGPTRTEIEQWGEIKLCWAHDTGAWALHISHSCPQPGLPGPASGTGDHGPSDEGAPVRVVTVAIDEGIINPLTMAHEAPDGGREVTVINGRSARAIKRERNKTVARLTSMLSRCKNGSRRHRRLVTARRKARGKARTRLRDFNHQTTAKAAKVVRAAYAQHRAAAPQGATVQMRVVAGDVRGIEKRTAERRRVNRSTRQQLSQWERAAHEHQLAYKTGLKIEYVDEAYTSQTCPACGRRRKVRGRRYVCANQACGFRLHRDAVGGVNILTLADNGGTLVPAGPDLAVRVTYLRAQPGWSPLQRELHGHHQHALGRARVAGQGSP